MSNRVAVFGALSAVLVVGITIAAWIGLGLKPTGSELGRFLLGQRAFDVVAPDPKHVYPVGGLEVLVTFAAEDRIDAQSFRCLLNGRDVTSLLTVGSNGAAGNVFPLREGANELRVELTARGLFGGDPVPDAVDIPIQVRPGRALDRG